jgi:hypothetical protein
VLIGLLAIALLMIAAPRVWVKNKKARLVHNGKVTPAFKLFFASGGRIMLAPEAVPRYYAYLPDEGGKVVACEPRVFRYMKIFTWGSTNRCSALVNGPTEVTPLKLVFTADEGDIYEVSWDADPRR